MSMLVLVPWVGAQSEAVPPPVVKRALPIGGDEDVEYQRPEPQPELQPEVAGRGRAAPKALPVEIEEPPAAAERPAPEPAEVVKEVPKAVTGSGASAPLVKPPGAVSIRPPVPAAAGGAGADAGALAANRPVTAVPGAKPVVAVPKREVGTAKSEEPAGPEATPIRRAVAVDDDEADIPITPEAPEVSANLKPSGEDAVKLQIFLDEACFGPGIIDGKPGRFTELAVRSWNEAKGHPLDDWRAVVTAARAAVPEAYAVAIVPDWVDKWVDPSLPTSRSKQAKAKRMSYRSVAELMAERYHCDIPYLIDLNGSRKVYNLKPRDSLVVPNVEAFRIEAIKEVSHPADEVMSQRHVVVDTRVNQLRVFEAAPAALVVDEAADAAAGGKVAAGGAAAANRALVASFPITPGKPQFIRLGTWELKRCVEMPYWRYDQQLLDTGKRSSEALNIPPGPNSPVGVIWNALSRPGIGLHGTSDPETIGRARSAGCIRLANWDAIRLPTLIRPGATVEIR